MKEQPISFPLTNAEFLKVISNSFCRFLRVKTSRSPEKLKPLHGAIAADLSRRLGEGYHICSQGFGLGKEFTVRGRYVPKRLNSTCKCNRILINNLFKFFVWREVSKSFTRSIIEFIFNPLNLFVGYFTKVLTLWDILPDKPVGVFIGTTFP